MQPYSDLLSRIFCRGTDTLCKRLGAGCRGSQEGVCESVYEHISPWIWPPSPQFRTTFCSSQMVAKGLLSPRAAASEEHISEPSLNSAS